MDTVDTQNAGWRQTFALVALALAIFSVIWFAAAALGTKLGLWSWTFGLGTMTGSVYAGLGRFVLALSLLAAIAAMLVALWKSPRKRPFIVAASALLISGYSGGRWMAFQLNALSLPPIHDIQTDWSNPIQFSEELIAIRKAAVPPNLLNDVKPDPVIELNEGQKRGWPGYDGKTVAEAQESMEQDPEKAGKDDKEKLYPPINTLRVDKPKAEVLAAIKSLIEDRGWDIVTEATDPGLETGVFEATHTSGWFGFKDDVAIHVLTGPDGTSIVDMRSVSRVGLSDLGANAKRVGNFMRDLRRVTAR